MNDEFFSKKKCDRCSSELNTRTMSWFTEETICMDCSSKEDVIKKNLSDKGSSFEGCGYLPTINDEVRK